MHGRDEMIKLSKELKSKKHVIAVSGGRDSMALFHMMRNFDIIVAHVNHRQRENSEIEERFLRQYCKEQNIPFEVYHLPDVPENVNFQQYARNERYGFFQSVLRAYAADDIVLAHHGDDLIETVLMSIVRGTGLKGLYSMKETTILEGVTYIRPLLPFARSDIDQYIEKHNILYFEDETNSSDVYTRNRFRNSIIPLLKEEQPALLDKVTQLSNQVFHIHNHLLDEIKDIKTRPLDRTEYLSLSIALQNEILVKILDHHSIQPHSNLLSKMQDIILGSKPNARVQLSSNLWLVRTYNQLLVRSLNNYNEVYLNVSELGTFQIDETRSFNVREITNSITQNINELCYNNFDFPVIIRTRKPGDKISLRTGTKKIKDLFIDLKIPKDERDNYLLVEHKGNIVWIPELNIYADNNNEPNNLSLVFKKGIKKNA